MLLIPLPQYDWIVIHTADIVHGEKAKTSNNLLRIKWGQTTYFSFSKLFQMNEGQNPEDFEICTFVKQ